MSTFYNEIDPFAAQWLRNLIATGHLAPGVVDERSIEDIYPDELNEFTQCHFFAGIGGWSYALRLAGWPDDCPVWTGSCPCQPFSTAGKGAGFTDERHLWPAFHHLIRACQPSVVFGEQVASKDGLGWLDLVQTDLENSGYTFGAADLCAASVGAPHIRQRLYWVAHSDERQRGSWRAGSRETNRSHVELARRSEAGQLADSHKQGLEVNCLESSRTKRTATERGSEVGVLADAMFPRWPERRPVTGSRPSPWRGCDWLPCRDGKSRPVEPGTFPLAHGVSSRVGRLRAYGNAIVPQVAEAFIRSSVDALELKDLLS